MGKNLEKTVKNIEKTIQNLKTGKLQSTISKNRQKCRKIVKYGKKPGENLQKYRKIVKNVEKCQKNQVRNCEI